VEKKKKEKALGSSEKKSGERPKNDGLYLFQSFLKAEGRREQWSAPLLLLDALFHKVGDVPLRPQEPARLIGALRKPLRKKKEKKRR